MTKTAGARLRALLEGQRPVVAPLVLDPISAMLAEQAGFQALYLGGGTMGYLKTGTEGNVSLTEMVQAGVEIGAASSLPLILDGICGWGDPMHMHHTMALAEAAGFAAIEIEDQILPKRAHHHVDIEHLVPIELMVAKIEEAVAARRDPDFVIIARTNACRTDDLDVAAERAEAYRQAGADMLLVLPRSAEEAIEVGERIDGPLVYMVPPTVGADLDELGRLGYRLVVEGVVPFLARQKALRLSYQALAAWQPDPLVGDDYAGEYRHVLDTIGLDALLDIERRTVEG